MKLNPVRYSSAVGESWHHFSFKVKYCHHIFDNEAVRNECSIFFIEAFERNNIRYQELGFDNNHVHGIIDIANYSRPQIAKLIKGYVAKRFFKMFPYIKRKYFYGSGLWSPAYYMESVGRDIEFMKSYVRKQRYYLPHLTQSKLEDYF